MPRLTRLTAQVFVDSWERSDSLLEVVARLHGRGHRMGPKQAMAWSAALRRVGVRLKRICKAGP